MGYRVNRSEYKRWQISDYLSPYICTVQSLEFSQYSWVALVNKCSSSTKRACFLPGAENRRIHEITFPSISKKKKKNSQSTKIGLHGFKWVNSSCKLGYLYMLLFASILVYIEKIHDKSYLYAVNYTAQFDHVAKILNFVKYCYSFTKQRIWFFKLKHFVLYTSTNKREHC